MTTQILKGDCRDVLKTLPDESVNCVVTSPPYLGLRDYGMAGQIGLEPTPAEFVAELVAVFSEVRRVLRGDGTVWLNLGDSYASAAGAKNGGLRRKDILGIPWRVAFGLQEDGWCLRQDIVWLKPNAHPENVTDRCTRSHEYIFLLAKNERYYFDAEAIREASLPRRLSDWGSRKANGEVPRHGDPGKSGRVTKTASLASREGRNKRSVWEVSAKPFPGAHFATFPPALIEPCILAGCPEGGTVLDPFGGAGTTGFVADSLKRNAILIELNPDYAAIAERRIKSDAGLFANVT